MNRYQYPLRLNGSEDSYSGELQVYVNGSWGSFCYGSFSFTTAKVLCKTLGYKTAESAYRINITNSSAPIAVDRAYCYGNVDTFYNCSWIFHREDEAYHYCYYNATVGVVCSDGERLLKYLCAGGLTGIFTELKCSLCCLNIYCVVCKWSQAFLAYVFCHSKTVFVVC